MRALRAKVSAPPLFAALSMRCHMPNPGPTKVSEDTVSSAVPRSFLLSSTIVSCSLGGPSMGAPRPIRSTRSSVPSAASCAQPSVARRPLGVRVACVSVPTGMHVPSSGGRRSASEALPNVRAEQNELERHCAAIVLSNRRFPHANEGSQALPRRVVQQQKRLEHTFCLFLQAGVTRHVAVGARTLTTWQWHSISSRQAQPSQRSPCAACSSCAANGESRVRYGICHLTDEGPSGSSKDAWQMWSWHRGLSVGLVLEGMVGRASEAAQIMGLCGHSARTHRVRSLRGSHQLSDKS